MSVKVSTTLSVDQYQALVRKADEFGKTIAEVVRAGIEIISADNGEAEFMFAPDEDHEIERQDHA
jgi:hypothetical protein